MAFCLMAVGNSEQLAEQSGVASVSGQDAPPRKRRCVSVGEVKRAVALAPGLPPQPIDLVAARDDPDHPSHSHACAVIDQLFTYLIMWRAMFGFITCWYGTWLAYCPPNDRGKLYLSRPILAGAKHTRDGEAPAATARGAVAYLQQQALATANTQVASPGGLAPGAGGTGDDDRAGAGGDSHEGDDQWDAGTEIGSGEVWTPSSGDHSLSSKSMASGGHHKAQAGSHGRPQPTAAATEVVLELRQPLCNGSEGAVLAGTCNGVPAVIKLLGPDGHGLAAFRRELHAYSVKLLAVQGVAVPRLLAAGCLDAGIHFLATEHVQGQPLSALPHISGPTAAAAQRALASVHSACPGLCHGDVRLANVLVLDQAEGAAARRGVSLQQVHTSEPKCMVIDFGRSFDGASAEQQLREQRLLESLVRARAPR